MNDIDIFSATENIIEILLNMQDFLRRPVIKNKLERFYLEDEKLQRDTILIILTSLPSEIKNIDKLIYVWLDVLAELEVSKINKIIQLYLGQFLKDKKLLNKIDVEVIINEYLKLEREKRIKLKNCFIESLFLLPYKEDILKRLPLKFLKTD